MAHLRPVEADRLHGHGDGRLVLCQRAVRGSVRRQHLPQPHEVVAEENVLALPLDVNCNRLIEPYLER